MPRGGRRLGAGRPRRLIRAVPSNAIISRPVRSQAMKKLARGVHYFKRTAYYNGYISGSTTADTLSSFVFELAQVPGYTEFQALFDMYKINAVKISFMPRANSAEIGTNQGVVKFFSVIDYDDNSGNTLNQLLQYESLKTTPSTRDHTRYLKPRVQMPVFQASPNAGYMGNVRGWLDCDTPSIPHYGVKTCLQQLPAGNQSYDIKVTYYLCFKNVR